MDRARTGGGRKLMNRIQFLRTYARVLASDTFTRANGTLGNAEVGGAWAVPEGTFAVSSNKAKGTAVGTSYAVLQLTQLNYSISADITWYTGDTIALVFRGTGTNSDDQMRIRFIAGTLSITRRLAGTNVDIATYSYTWSSGSSHNIKAVCNGNTFTCYLDGTQVMTATDDNTTKSNLYVGLLSSKSGSAPATTFDNLRVE